MTAPQKPRSEHIEALRAELKSYEEYWGVGPGCGCGCGLYEVAAAVVTEYDRQAYAAQMMMQRYAANEVARLFGGKR